MEQGKAIYTRQTLYLENARRNKKMHGKDPEHNPIKKFIDGNKTRKYAIWAKCAQCVGCDDEYLENGFRKMITNCKQEKCSLYIFRPYQK